MSPTFSIENYTHLLFSVAYKMTGEVHISKDLSQEVLLEFYKKKHQNEVKQPKSYLIKATINRTINYLNKIKKERALYHGVWLPEPITDTEEKLDAEIDLDYGMTVLLSRLNPKERAVFILRNAFDFKFKEIAKALELKESGCRKIYQRVQPKVASNNKGTTLNGEKERLLTAFLAATKNGNMDDFIQILKEDIALYADGGGKVAAAKHPLFGRVVIGKFLWGLYQKFGQGFGFKLGEMNGEPVLMYYSNEKETLEGVAYFEIDNGQIARIYMLRNPDKLSFFEKKEK